MCHLTSGLVRKDGYRRDDFLIVICPTASTGTDRELRMDQAAQGRARHLLPRPCLGQPQGLEPHVPYHNSDAVLLQRGLVIGHFTHAHHGGSPVLLQVLG